MKTKKTIVVTYLYVLSLILATVFSYTQVDLNLTLLNWAPYLQIQSFFTQLGYFNRPVNAAVWSVILGGLIISYLHFVKVASENSIDLKSIFRYVYITAAILIFSYTIFSHDIFNYIFDAKIVTKYHLNPYEYKALDFPNDEWIRFMQWTHRTYPYGPLWLVITAIPSILGLGKFLPTLILFKSMFAFLYIFSVKMIDKCADKLEMSESQKNTAIVLFAFHPLVLIEGLISPRIDMAMIALSLAGLYLYLNAAKFKPWSIVAMIVSGAVKFATWIYIPILLIPKKRISTTNIIRLLTAASIVTTIMQSLFSKKVQPWYFLVPLSLLPLSLKAFGSQKVKGIMYITICILWIYIYFLATGEWKGVLWFT